MNEYVAGVAIVAVAGFVQGIIGFGFAMIAVPMFMLYQPATTVVPLVAALSFFNVVHMSIVERRHVRRAIVLPLLLGGLAGLPLGIACLVLLDGALLKAGVGIVLVVFAALLYSGRTWPIRRERVALPFVGVLSGFLSGSTQLTGPPVVLFLANQNASKDVFRANLVAYFSLMAVAGLGLYAWQGFFTARLLMFVAISFPVNVLASMGGIHVAGRISEERFRHVAMACAGLTGLVLAIENAAALID